jgi:hypothetical protein
MNAAERIADLLRSPGVGRIFALLGSEGGQARIVGGAVRNALLGRPVRDIDFATALLPEAVMARCAAAGLRALPTGIEHGTVTVLAEGARFEVTTLRRDVDTDGRRAVVAYSASFEEDASRRDFTINQFSLSADGVVHDYAGAFDDLAARKVRFIGDPASRIREDYLRILRFFRFHAEYAAGDLDGPGLAACIALRGGLGQLSAERIREELLKTLVADGAGIVVPLASGMRPCRKWSQRRPPSSPRSRLFRNRTRWRGWRLSPCVRARMLPGWAMACACRARRFGGSTLPVRLWRGLKPRGCRYRRAPIGWRGSGSAPRRRATRWASSRAIPACQRRSWPRWTFRARLSIHTRHSIPL